MNSSNRLSSCLPRQLPSILALGFLLWIPLPLFSAGFELAGDSHLEWIQEDDLILASRGCAVTSITYENADLSGTVVPVDAGSEEALESGVRITYDWGNLALVWEIDEGVAYGTFTLENTSDQVIADFSLRLLGLSVSDSNMDTEGFEPVSLASLDNTAFHSWISKDTRITAGLISVNPPLWMIAESEPAAEGFSMWALRFTGGVHSMSDGGVSMPILGSARIEPGETLSWQFILKETAASLPDPIAHAVFWSSFYRKTNQPVDWPDRRPLGMLFVHSNSSESNPMGLFWDSSLDASDPDAVLAKAISYTQRTVDSLTAVDAQGAIFWDLEGGFNTDVWFAGDPRMLSLLNPAMDAVADTMFSMLTDAGFETGLTLRLTQIYFDEDRDKWRHGTGSHGPDRNPLDENYDEIWPEGLPWWRFFPIVERLDRKIQYAKNRWGCRMFYIDTNGVYREKDAPNNFKFVLMNAALMRELTVRHPDVLIIPELSSQSSTGTHLANWGCCVPYGELDLGKKGTASWIRNTYPDAFSAINVSDGDIEGNRSQLVESVRSGDILLFRGWFNDGRNSTVREIYEEAATASP